MQCLSCDNETEPGKAMCSTCLTQRHTRPPPVRGFAGVKPEETVEREDGYLSENYAGFWIRLRAYILDSILAVVILIVLAILFYIAAPEAFLAFNQLDKEKSSIQIIINIIGLSISIIFHIGFWATCSATPGKIVLRIKIIDIHTGERPSTIKLFLRYFGYIVSTIPLALGYIWIGIDSRKQGFHDKIAGTAVVKY